MTTATVTHIGFVSPNATWGAHYDDLLALVPDGVQVDIQPLGLYRTSLNELSEAGGDHLAKTTQLVAERGWQGVAVTGAPMQVQNRDLPDRLRAATGVPVTTALESSTAALRALSAERALVLTPFDESMNALVGEYLAGAGIDAVFPETAIGSVPRAVALSADEVYDLAKGALMAASGVEAIYFQGARLNPLGCLERMETDFSVPVVASNPAMLWNLLSLLGIRRPSGEGLGERRPSGVGGRLLREWPALVDA